MVPYKATSRKQIVNAINSYTQEVTVLAPSVWDPEARLEPPDNLPSVVKRYKKKYIPYHNGAKLFRNEDSFFYIPTFFFINLWNIPNPGR